jgi:hypothetical protein
MEGDPKKTKQGKISPFVFVWQGKLSAHGNGNSQNDHSYCKAQPDNYDRRSIGERDLGGTYQNYGCFER